MKKVSILVLLVFIIILLCVACGKRHNTVSDRDNEIGVESSISENNTEEKSVISEETKEEYDLGNYELNPYISWMYSSSDRRHSAVCPDDTYCYYSDEQTGIIIERNGISTKISSGEVNCLNASDQYLYFSNEEGLFQYNLETNY